MNLDPETTTLMATLSRGAHRLARSPPEQSASLDLEDAAAAAAVSGVSEATRRLSHSHSDMGLRQEDGDKDHHHHHQPSLHSQIFDLEISGKCSILYLADYKYQGLSFPKKSYFQIRHSWRCYKKVVVFVIIIGKPNH